MTTAADDSMSRITLGLSQITRLLASLSSPQLAVPVVHIAGTNGKGSVCAYLESILLRSGFSVGKFVSPHLVEPRDSITLNGAPLSSEEYASRIEEVRAVAGDEKPSPFEELTAAAFLAFSRAKGLDLAVVEVGMGGATDATNVCPSETTLAVGITPVDLDHQALLGDTVEEIARVKAGIIKEGVPTVLGRQKHPGVDEVVVEVAAAHRSDLFRPADGAVLSSRSARIPLTPPLKGCSEVSTTLSLAGGFQLSNAETAALLATTLATHRHPVSLLPSLADRITPSSIASGIAETRWPGRAEWLSFPRRMFDTASSSLEGDVEVLIDGAHNPSAADALGEFLASLPPAPTSLVLAVSTPRDPLSILRPLLGRLPGQPTRIWTTGFSRPEGMPWVKPLPPQDILAASSGLPGVEIEQATTRVEQAVSSAVQKARPGERIVVCGSLYLVADVVRWHRSLQHSA